MSAGLGVHLRLRGFSPIDRYQPNFPRQSERTFTLAREMTDELDVVNTVYKSKQWRNSRIICIAAGLDFGDRPRLLNLFGLQLDVMHT